MHNAYRLLYAYNRTVGAASSAGARAVPVGVSVLRLVVTVDTYVSVGSTASANIATSMLMLAGSTEHFLAHPGDKIFVMRAGADNGYVNIAEMTR